MRQINPEEVKKAYAYFQSEPLNAEMMNKLAEYANRHYRIPDLEMIKRPSQIEGIRKASEINTKVLDAVASKICAGMSTQDIDDIVMQTTEELGGVCSCLGFEGYPKSVCVSVNEEVCHGIPTRLKKLKEGDIVNVDCTTYYQGFYGDASRMFMIGEVSSARRRLVEETKKCLEIGISVAKPYNTIGDIGYAIQKYARSRGYSVVRELGGHGVGLEMHEDPFVAHVGKAHDGVLLVPGMVITIEPMINEGKAAVVIDPYNEWTISTKDSKDSAQWEHTILITEDGNEILSY